jgi:hypothetical protein
MDYAVESKNLGERLRQPLGQDRSLTAPLQSLIWITKTPQDPSHNGETPHLGNPTMNEGHRALLLGIIQGKATLQMFSGQNKLSTPIQGGSQSPVSLYEKREILCFLSQMQKLLREFARWL